LVVRGTMRLEGRHPGFESRGVLTFEISLPRDVFGADAQRLAFFEQAHDRLAQLPGIEGVAMASALPASGNLFQAEVEIEGRPTRGGAADTTALRRVVSPDYFDTLRIPLLAGRGLDARDRADTVPVAVVSASTARRFWPEQDPLGKRLRFAEGAEEAPWLEVVGVAGDVTNAWFEGPGQAMVYQAVAQRPQAFMAFAVRTAGEPLDLVAQAEDAIQALAPDQPIDAASTLPQLIQDRSIGLRYASGVMGVFGAIAVVLAAIGLYGLMSFAVGCRTRELGVRVALGARRSQVLRSAVGGPVAVVAAGTACGLLLAFAAARWMASAMFGLVVVELAVFAALAGVLLAVAALAAFGPARRALRVDPVITLRAE
jgi:putative ABC transport system permease protein